MTSLEGLERFCRSENRVCPMPVSWMRLYDMIVRGDKNTPLSVPLILAAWDGTTHLDKMVRLVEHLHFAEQNGTLEEADAYLRGLPLSSWFRSGGMTQQEEETESRLSEMRLWVGALTALVVVVLSIVGFGSVGNLIVREDGSIARGSQIGGRVHYYLAPRIQGQRFWREQLVIVRERLDEEDGAVERYADELRRRELKLAQDLEALSIAAGKERSSFLLIDPSTGQTWYERSIDVANKSFEEDVERIVTKINQHPEKYQRLEAIERAILKRSEM